MAVEVRHVSVEEFPEFSRTMAAGFGFHYSDEQVERRRAVFEEGRSLAAVVDGEMVGTARSFNTELTLPGGATLPAGAVTNVAVRPSHRRRGALSGMMAQQLDDIAAAGEPLAILIASEHPIYGRYGYGVATTTATLEIDRLTARLLPSAPDATGVCWVSVEESRREAPAVYERFRRTQPGAILRSDRLWDWAHDMVEPSREPGSVWYLLHDDGYAKYRLEDRWVDRQSESTLHVEELVAVTAAAYGALWRTCLEMDLIATVKAADRPEREPLPWLLTDARHARRTSVCDFLWLRILDLPRALEARSYPVDGRMVLDVLDPMRPASGGRVVLEAGTDGASCRPAPAGVEPDLTLGTAALAACYLGDARPSLLAQAGLVDEGRPGALATADALFASTPAPWCHTWF